MNPDQNSNDLPPISTAPTDQHGQIMYALGLLNGEMKGIQNRQDMTNGKVLKAGSDIIELQRAQSQKAGADQGVSKTFLIILNVILALVAIISLYLKFTK